MKEFLEDSDSLPAAPASDWTQLRSGQSVTVAEKGHNACSGTIDAVTPDASILWVRLTGATSPRRMFLCTDPVDIRPAHRGN